MSNFNYKIVNQSFKWREDDDGFLRCTTSVLKDCVMNYGIDELEGMDVPAALQGMEFIRLYVPSEEIDNDVSLKSLEGKPIALSHDWQTTGCVDAVGTVAGSPEYKDGYLYSDILINDPKTINRIKGIDSDKLVDQSAAYTMNVDWTPGVTESGEPYDGVQRNIRYNHVALLPQGMGRAGEDVRVINKGKGVTMSDYVSVKFGNSRIRVLNEDVEKMESEVDKKEEGTKNAIDPSELEASMTQVGDLNGQIETLSSERDELAGKLQQLKEQIEELTNPEMQAKGMKEAMQDRKDSDAIMNEYDLNDDDEEDGVDVMIGNSLKQHVIKKVRAKNSKLPLTDDQLANKDFVNGMFMSLKESCKRKKIVNGASVVKTENSAPATSSNMSAADRLAVMRNAKRKGA